jgi:hypothetical protein
MVGLLMSIPTTGETFAKLIEHLRLAQEDCAMMAHLLNAEGTNHLGKQWLLISEMLKKAQYNITHLAKRGLQ